MNSEIEGIKKRLDKLEKEVFGVKKTVKKMHAKKSLSDHIMTLRDKGFFKSSCTAEEVHKELQSEYSCEKNRVAVALFRLQKKKQLRKASKVIDGKQTVAYVW